MSMNKRVKKLILGYLAFIVAGTVLGIAVSLLAGLPIEAPAMDEAPAADEAPAHPAEGGGH